MSAAAPSVPPALRLRVNGPAGALQAVVESPAGAPVGWALLCHPHPVHGGTMDNKVVTTLARTLLGLGWRVARFNTRGTGESEGQWDGGVGEVDDAQAVLQAIRPDGRAPEARGTASDAAAAPLLLAGFSFGGFIAAQLAQRLPPASNRLLLVAPAVVNFPMPDVAADTRVLWGDADEIIPVPALEAWAARQPLQHPPTVLPGAGHFFHGRLSDLRAVVQQMLQGGPPSAA